ncbi:MAG: diheme cytochrome c-553 [Thermodesulfobacteriota bacterium]
MKSNAYLYILISVLFVILIFSIPGLLASKDMDKEIQIKMGKLMTEEFGCVDCHSPKIIINNQVMIDENKMFSGHPRDNKLPDFPPELVGPGKWRGLYTSGMTAWGGPWGISYSANLTPDKETGIGTWSEENFKSVIKLGIHSSLTRKMLPPMPWNEISRLNDVELEAIFLYLKSLKPIKNKVPESKPLYSHEDLANR